MNLNDISIKIKMIVAFCTAAILVGFIGLNGYLSTIMIKKSATVVDAAMEMKLAVRGDMQMIMELLASEDMSGLNEMWKEHLQLVDEFGLFYGAILNGVETSEGTIYATSDEKVKSMLEQAEAMHNDRFLPGIGEIYKLKKQIIASEESDNSVNATLIEVDKKADATGEEIMKVLGGVEERTKVDMDSVVQTVIFRTITGTVAAVIFAIVGGFFLAIGITGPLNKAIDFAGKMSKGDLTNTLPIAQGDETGILAVALNEMNDSLRTMFQEIISGTHTLSTASTELAGISNQMSANAEQTTDKTNTVAAASEEMSINMNSVAAASEETSVNVNMVAAATEEMASTIAEIASNTEKTKAITETAVTQSNNASIQIKELGIAAQEIGKVTETITEISEQTNLLALNATIEAARAGEAGKGFAVVANEIKDLANQTSEATGEIKDKISKIQVATRDSVTEIGQITGVISEVNEMVSAISITVEEQSSATQEISNNVSQASQGIQEVNENVNHVSSVTGEIATAIADVGQASNEINDSSSLVSVSAEGLEKFSKKLTDMVNKFKV